jgi:hypothetical protein
MENINMQVISIKRAKDGGPLKIYGKILGESGKIYNFAYYRGIHREWQCTCESFMLSEKGKNGNCKHLRFVRKTYGRYGATVQPTQAAKAVAKVLTQAVIE